MPKKSKTFIRGLQSVVAINPDDARFTRTQIAGAFGCQRYEISRDASLLWGQSVQRSPLSRDQVEMLYIVRCWRQFCQDVRQQTQVSGKSILEFAQQDTPVLWTLCERVGGGEEHCQSLIQQMIDEQLATAIAAQNPITN